MICTPLKSRVGNNAQWSKQHISGGRHQRLFANQIFREFQRSSSRIDAANIIRSNWPVAISSWFVASVFYWLYNVKAEYRWWWWWWSRPRIINPTVAVSIDVIGERAQRLALPLIGKHQTTDKYLGNYPSSCVDEMIERSFFIVRSLFRQINWVLSVNMTEGYGFYAVFHHGGKYHARLGRN